MSFLAYKKQVLGILVENLKNKQPEVVDSSKIAEKLNMTVKETCQLIRIMNSMGVVQSDQDGQRALITREGLRSLDRVRYSKVA